MSKIAEQKAARQAERDAKAQAKATAEAAKLAHPVAKAVEPLRQEAKDRARKDTQELIDRYAAMLAEAGGDANKAAPYPRNLPRYQHEIAHARYSLLRSLVIPAPGHRPTYRPSEPEPSIMCPDKAARLIEQQVRAADAAYTAFVFKLVGKVGACESATISGSHVWGHSILTVTKDGGVIERWKTQQIVNVSKLGLHFNQWPTRLIK